MSPLTLLIPVFHFISFPGILFLNHATNIIKMSFTKKKQKMYNFHNPFQHSNCQKMSQFFFRKGFMDIHHRTRQEKSCDELGTCLGIADGQHHST